MHRKMIKPPTRAKRPFKLQRKGMPRLRYNLEIEECTLVRDTGAKIPGTAVAFMSEESAELTFVADGVLGMVEFRDQFGPDQPAEPCQITGRLADGTVIEASGMTKAHTLDLDSLVHSLTIWLEELTGIGDMSSPEWDEDSLWALLPGPNDFHYLMNASSYMRENRGMVGPDQLEISYGQAAVTAWAPLTGAYTGKARQHPGLLLQISPAPPLQDLDAFWNRLRVALGMSIHQAAPWCMAWLRGKRWVWRQPVHGQFIPSRGPLVMGNPNANVVRAGFRHAWVYWDELSAKNQDLLLQVVSHWCSATSVGVPEEAAFIYCTTIENVTKLWAVQTERKPGLLIPESAFKQWQCAAQKLVDQVATGRTSDPSGPGVERFKANLNNRLNKDYDPVSIQACIQELRAGTEGDFKRYRESRNRLMHQGTVVSGSLIDRHEERLFLRALATKMLYGLIGYKGPLNPRGERLSGVEVLE